MIDHTHSQEVTEPGLEPGDLTPKPTRLSPEQSSSQRLRPPAAVASSDQARKCSASALWGPRGQEA